MTKIVQPIFEEIKKGHGNETQLGIFYGAPPYCYACGDYVTEYPFICVDYHGLYECMESWYTFLHPKCMEQFLLLSDHIYFKFN